MHFLAVSVNHIEAIRLGEQCVIINLKTGLLFQIKDNNRLQCTLICANEEEICTRACMLVQSGSLSCTASQTCNITPLLTSHIKQFNSILIQKRYFKVLCTVQQAPYNIKERDPMIRGSPMRQHLMIVGRKNLLLTRDLKENQAHKLLYSFIYLFIYFIYSLHYCHYYTQV